MNIRCLFVLSIVMILSLPGISFAQVKKNGKCKIVDEKGNVSKGKMKDSLKTGVWKTYDIKKRQTESITYTMGIENGECIYFFPDDSMYTKGAYVNGKVDGTWSTYTNKGLLVHSTGWTMDTLNGVYYDHSGGKSVNGQYTKGKKAGWWIENDTKEHKLDSIFYLNGKKQGRNASYKNGTLVMLSYWDNNRHEGRYYEFEDDGKPKLEMYYHLDAPDSVRREYKNGKLKEEHWFCGGRFCGTAKTYNEQGGYLEMETSYDSTGNRMWYAGYDEQGNRIRKSWFSQSGQMDSIYVYRNTGSVWYLMKDTGTTAQTRGKVFFQDFKYPSGYTQFSGCIENSRRTGTWLYYDSTGKIERRMNYKDGNLMGSFTAYYPNGKVKLQTYCFGGIADTMYVYSDKGKLIPQTDSLFNATLLEIKNTQQDITFHNPNDIPKDVLQRPVSILAVTRMQEASMYDFPPSYPGGMDSLNAFVKRTAVYPAYERAHGTQGTVWIEFMVGLDGRLSDIHTSGGDNPCLQKEALRVTRLMPAWIPGNANGTKQVLKYTYGIEFKLN